MKILEVYKHLPPEILWEILLRSWQRRDLFESLFLIQSRWSIIFLYKKNAYFLLKLETVRNKMSFVKTHIIYL